MPPQVQAAGPQLIVLDYMSGWGVNGSFVTLRPDTPLPTPTPSPPPSPSSSQGMSSGAVAGIVVGSIAGAAILAGVVAAFLLRRYVWCAAWRAGVKGGAAVSVWCGVVTRGSREGLLYLLGVAW